MIFLTIIGAMVGAVVGYCFNRSHGRRAAGSIIAGNPIISIIYWAIIGGLIVNILVRLLK